jgi:U4/U6 small nuclear ribonucleoprotein SNU13
LLLEDTRIKADPLADKNLTQKLLHLLNQSKDYKQLKKGMNESLKALSRSTPILTLALYFLDICEIIIMAGDCDPLEILSNIPVLC